MFVLEDQVHLKQQLIAVMLIIINTRSKTNPTCNYAPPPSRSRIHSRTGGSSWVKILSRLDLGDETQAGVALVPDNVHALQEDITQDIEGVVATGLHTTVPVTLRGDSERKVLRLDRELVVANSHAEGWELINSHGRGEQVTLLLLVVLGSRNLLVQSLDNLIGHQGEGGASIGNGLVARLGDCLASNGGGGGVEHPEPLRVVDVGVLNGVAADQVGIDVSEGVERLGIVVARRVEGRSEQLSVRGDVALGDHVGNGSVLGISLAALGDCVDGWEGETEQSVTSTRDELVSGNLGQLDSLVLDRNATDVDRISADIARRGAAITIRDLPGQTRRRLPGRRLGGVEHSVVLLIRRRELGRKDLWSC